VRWPIERRTSSPVWPSNSSALSPEETAAPEFNSENVSRRGSGQTFPDPTQRVSQKAGTRRPLFRHSEREQHQNLMALIIRIDVDRPYGRGPILRHFLSRLSSDLYFPKMLRFGFLSELQTILTWLNEEKARAYVFFRRCTLPSKPILELLDAGCHEIGLHLENSRSFATFLEERRIIEHHLRKEVLALSKHGSGGARYGLHHHPPYEPDRYIEWAQRVSMRLFLGNLQDPSLETRKAGDGLLVFPSAFWLEPSWRDTKKFTIDWLVDRARYRDVVLLIHPENVLAHPGLAADFKKLIKTLKSRIFSD